MCERGANIVLGKHGVTGSHTPIRHSARAQRGSIALLQTFFGIATVIYLCLGAAGSGLAGVAASSYIHSGAQFGFAIKVSMWASLAILLVGMGCLFVDLGRPFVALNISFFSNFDSWAARGFWLLLASLFVYALLLIVISKAPSRAMASRWAFYRRNRDGIARVLSWLTAALSTFVAFYTGFLLYESLGVPFWRTLLMPVLFLFGSANMGLCLFLWINSLRSSARGPQRRQGAEGPGATPATVVTLLIEAALLALYLIWASNSPTAAVVQSFNRLVFGELSLLFWLGVVLTGLLIPFLTTLLKASPLGKKHATTLTTLALLTTTIGLAALRYTILFSGITLY
jgi:formate-dependent nitrite reductase membrane component NrfD